MAKKWMTGPEMYADKERLRKKSMSCNKKKFHYQRRKSKKKTSFLSILGGWLVIFLAILVICDIVMENMVDIIVFGVIFIVVIGGFAFFVNRKH